MHKLGELSPWQYTLVALFVLLFGLLAVASSWNKNHTVDAINYVGWGRYYIATGDFYSLELYNPPLTAYLLDLPNYFLALPPIEQWDKSTQHALGYYYLYKTGYDTQFLTRLERIPIIIVSMLLVLLVWLWSYQLFGWEGSFISLIFSSVFPLFLGYGSILLTDNVFAFTTTLSLYCYWQWLRQPCKKSAILAGAATGLALLAKLTAVFLLPIFVILWIWKSLSSGGKVGWHKRLLPGVEALTQFIIILLAGLVTVWAGYGFDLQTIQGSIPQRYLGEGGRAEDYYKAFEAAMPFSPETSSWLWNKLPLPLTSYAITWFYSLNLNKNSSWAYLLGENIQGSWWYYFPIAFLFKTPLWLIIALLLAIFFFRLRSLREDWFVPLLGTVVLFALQMTSSINYGIRHLLHVYGFLLILVGVLGLYLTKKWLRIAVSILLLWAILSSLAAYPEYISYFNALALGKGEHILLDSNLDFGQDLMLLGKWVDQNNISTIQLSYYGTADPDYFVPNHTYLASVLGRGIPLQESCSVQPGYAAISLTNLYAVYFENKSCFAQLRDTEPLRRIGGSINVYNIR